LTRRPFNARALIAGYRAACIAADIDPATGNPCANDDPGWWARDYLMWQDPGPAHSPVEAEALASIAAQVRRIAGVPEPETVEDAVRAAWDEDAERRSRQIALPLRELHAARGETVEMIVGVRMLVPVQLLA
jgi:hypothetical protein